MRVIGPGEGELVGDSTDRRVEILCDRDPLHVTWSRFAPGREGADRHVHRLHTDLFYVLAGELTLMLGADEEVVVPAGTLARMPALVVHGFRNGGDAEVRYLNLHAPGVGFADFMRGLRDGRPVGYDQEPPPAEGTRPASDAAIGERRETDRPGVALLADVPELRVTEVTTESGWTPGDGEAAYVLEGELAGSWVEGAEIPGRARLLAVRAPRS
jgi:mannose-6-phosphate isomerase-like protein (cupin superfamily)